MSTSRAPALVVQGLYGNASGASSDALLPTRLVHRYELSDAQWEAVASLLPSAVKTGRPAHDAHTTLNGVF